MTRRLLFGALLLFAFTSTFSISLSQSSLAVVGLLTLIVIAQERINPFDRAFRPFLIAVGVYLLWLIVVCLLQANPVHSLDHIREEWLFLIIPFGVVALDSEEKCDRLIGALAAGLLLVSAAGLIMYLFGVSYKWGHGFVELPPTNPRVRGNFTHALTFGNYAAVGSTLLLSWAFLRQNAASWIRRLAFTGGTVGLLAMLFTGSRGPVLAVVVVALSLLWLIPGKKRLWIIGLLGLVVIVGLLSPAGLTRYSTELGWQFKPDWAGSRAFIWRNSLNIIIDHPLTGVGPGNFSEAYKTQVGPEVGSRFWYGHAHNDFLQAAARSGIIGALTLAGVWIGLGLVLMRAAGSAGLSESARAALLATMLASLAFMVTSLTEATFYDEEVRALLMLVWAIGLATVYNSRRAGDGRLAFS